MPAEALSQDELALASMQLMAAQLRLVGDPEYASVVDRLSELRVELQRPPVLRVIPGGCDV